MGWFTMGWFTMDHRVKAVIEAKGWYTEYCDIYLLFGKALCNDICFSYN